MGVAIMLRTARWILIPKFSFFWSLQEEDEVVVASCVLRSFDEDAYDSPDEDEEWNDLHLKTNLSW